MCCIVSLWCRLVCRNSVELNFVKIGLKSKFGVNLQSFSHELCLYITRFYFYMSAMKVTWYVPTSSGATCSYSFQEQWSNDIIWFTKTEIKVFAFPGSIYRVGYDLLLQIEVKTLGGRNDSRWNWSRWTTHKSAHHTWTEHTRLQMWFHWSKPASNTCTVPSEIHGPCGFRVYYCNELWSTWLSSPAVKKKKKCWVY